MTTLLLTRGIPGSGKSTFAREWVDEDPEGRVRLNRDDIRQMMYGKGHGLTHAQEKMVTRTQRSAATSHLRQGKSVIIDDTNLRLRFAREWASLAERANVDFEVRDFVIDVDVAIKQDAERDQPVGEDVIRMFAERYRQPWPEVTPLEPRRDSSTPARYVPDVTKPRAWIVDIDGTLAHHGERSPYDWSRVGEDEVDVVVMDLVERLDKAFHIVLVSGRDAVCRAETEAWLAEHCIDYSALHMRPEGDNRPDHVVKAEIFDNHIRHNYNVIGVLDDRDGVVKMWRSMGLKCFQVAPGGF